MSQFLGFESFLVPIGASIDDVKNTIKTAFTSRNYQVMAESVQATSLIGAWTTNSSAFDGDPTTAASTSAALPQSIGARVAGGFTPTKLTIHGPSDPTLAPTNFSLDYSDNGTTWTTLQSWPSEVGWSLYEKRSYVVSGAASHPYWRLTVNARNGGSALAIANLILEDAAGRQVYNGYYILDLLPPATETIGGSGAFEFVRFKFTSNAMGVIGLKKWTVGFPQQVYAYPTTAGAVTLSLTLNGHTVSYTGGSANTATDNIVGLYAAIRDSVDSEFIGWDWELSYPAPQNADDTKTYILGTNKTVQDQKTITGSNVTAALLAYPIRPGFTMDEWIAPSWASCTTDLVNGFIYYLQINSRGFAFATKTNANYYGPMHACWSKHDAALAYMPTDNKYLTPIELVYGYDDDNTNEDSWGRVATIWGLNRSLVGNINYRATLNPAPPSGGFRRHRFTEVLVETGTADAGIYRGGIGMIQLRGSGLFSDDQTVGNDFQIHRVKTIWHTVAYAGPAGSLYYGVGVAPGFEIEDWYKFRGTATNEALSLVADPVATTPLASNYTPGDTVVNLTDASGFQSSGFIIIDTEAIQYTGKSGNQLTGVTGGKYATVASRHFAGDQVSQGLWFVIINGGALLAGYNKPS